jgi:hypothetical protein
VGKKGCDLRGAHCCRAALAMEVVVGENRAKMLMSRQTLESSFRFSKNQCHAENGLKALESYIWPICKKQGIVQKPSARC